MVDDNDMDEKDDSRRYLSRYKNERVKSRNLSEKKRRDQFNLLINELCSMVTSSTRKMDKSSVLQATISFLRNHNELSLQSQTVEVQENWKPPFLSNEEFTHLMLEALDGFIIVFSCTGKMLYTSESITSLLGYLPGEMCSSIFDMVHECDQPSLCKLINNASSSTNSNSPMDANVSLLVHMKRGPISSHQNPICEFVRLDGIFHHWTSSTQGPNTYNYECDSNSCGSTCSHLSSQTVAKWHFCFVAMARLQNPHLLRVVNLLDESKSEFISRHSLEWKFLFLDYRAPPIIGYLPFELLGTSGYDYYHVDDLESIVACHEVLIQTGEGTSCFYRFLTKGQQWIWLQTHYYITYHQWNSKPEFIVCTHSVIRHECMQESLHHASPSRKKLSKKKGILSGNTCGGNLSNRITCMSPALSTSSQGSLSSDHSERCSVVTSNIQNHAGLCENHCKENNSKLVPNDSPFPKAIEEARINVITTTRDQLNIQKTDAKDTVIIPPLCQALEQQSSAQGAASVVTLTTIQPYLGLPNSQVLTANNLVVQGQASQTEGLQPTFILTPSQNQLQDYLRHRHQVLQQQILIQQEELQRVSEQLMLVQFVAPNASTTTNICQTSSSLGSNVSGIGVSVLHHHSREPTLCRSNENDVIKSEISSAAAQHTDTTSASIINTEVDIRLVSTS